MNKYFRAILTNLFYFGISSIFFLVITRVAIRAMGEEFFGLWSILNAILLFSGIGNLGMGIAVNKFVSENGEDAHNAGTIIFTGSLILIPMAILSALILIMIRDWMIPGMAVPLALRDDFSWSMVLVAFSLFPQYLSRIPHGYLLSQLKNSISRFFDLIVHVLTWVGAIILALMYHDLKLMTLWMLLIQILNMVVLFGLVIRLVGFNHSIDLKIFKRMTNFSIFSFLESLAITFYQQLDRIVVGFVLGPSAAGAYAIGTSVGLRLSLITGQVTDVMVPYASRKDAENKREKLLQNFRHMTNLINYILAVLAVFLVVWMKEILSIWISPDYSARYSTVFSLLIMAYLLLSLSRPGHQTLTGIGLVSLTAGIYLLTSVCMIAGVYLFSSRFGLMGAAAANLFSAILLIYNLNVNFRLSGKLQFKAFMNDVGLSISLTIIGFGLVLWNASPFVRFLFTMSVLIMILILCWRDQFIKGNAVLILSKIRTAASNGSSKHTT